MDHERRKIKYNVVVSIVFGPFSTDGKMLICLSVSATVDRLVARESAYEEDGERYESLSFPSLPPQTLVANIDFNIIFHKGRNKKQKKNVFLFKHKYVVLRFVLQRARAHTPFDFTGSRRGENKGK